VKRIIRTLLKNFFRFLGGLLDRIIAVFGAVGLAQFPQFFSQYIQRLGGHLAEAQFILVRYEMTAEYFGMTLEEYIATHLNSGHEVFVSSGQLITELMERITFLEESLTALKEASIYTRWWVFARKFNYSIAQETWLDFTPGIPTTLEGVIYAICGLLLSWVLFQALKTLLKFFGKVISTPFSRRKKYMFPA
jgi:hypothetical protein